MNLQNAAEGVAKLYKAAIIELITALCTTIAVIMGVLTAAATAGIVAQGIQQGNADNINAAGVIAGGAGTLIFTLGAAVLGIICLVLQIKGTSLAKQDEANTKYFSSAYICILVSLICTVLGAVLSGLIPVLAKILTSVGGVFEIFIAWYILKGVWSIAEQIGDNDLAARAQSASTVVAIVIAISLIFKWIPQFFANGIGQAIGVVLAIVAFVLSIAQIIMYLSVLKRAKVSFLR
ncbi:MAG: hypothetical protein IK152_02760 [Lachnospiraceae bacterium]|nr:hypothetical protein [Lachnospiraceae bacterium]